MKQTYSQDFFIRIYHTCLASLLAIALPLAITSYHGFHDHSLTIHRALFKKIDDCVVKINWKDMLIQVINGLEYLHIRHKVIHNDLKSDNIVLTSTNLQHSSVGAVIIDFGKACELARGKVILYHIVRKSTINFITPKLHLIYVMENLSNLHLPTFILLV